MTGKTEIGLIDGQPEKRIFLSIISDYTLRTGLCELIDNAIDLWLESESEETLVIDVDADPSRQMITVRDNAGGVSKEQLRLLISPGATRNAQSKEVIGTFGVGGKRAGVALGELVQIRTRHADGESFEVDITKEWLAADDWKIPYFEIDDISVGTTEVTISHLRTPLEEGEVDSLFQHLGETYAAFINRGCRITLNAVPIEPIRFDAWAFPPDCSPQTTSFLMKPQVDGGEIQVSITGGLILDRDPERENYGVYFYCNDRLVAKEVRTREVGYYVPSEAGVPHPDASLARTIVQYRGGSELMPWNSSKSAINFNDPAFKAIASAVIDTNSQYTAISRRLKNERTERVFAFQEGEVEVTSPQALKASRRKVPARFPLARRPSALERLRNQNRQQLEDQPWTQGLVESIGVLDVLKAQRLETGNRIALILLDSNFEIALKEFIVHRTDLFPPKQFKNLAAMSRNEVVDAVGQRVSIPQTMLDKVRHYYLRRNSLIHERATQQITDTEVADYRAVVEHILGMLFKLSF